MNDQGSNENTGQEPLTPTQDAANEKAPAAQPAPSTEPEAPAVPDLEPAPNVNLTNNPFIPGEEFKKNILFPIYGLRESADEFAELLQRYPQLNVTKSEDGREWVRAVNEATDGISSLRDNFRKRLNDPESQWGQHVDNGGEKIAMGRMGSGPSDDPTQKLSGETALIKLSAAMGLGSVIIVPLWHSGLWVSLKAPSSGELAILDRQIANEKLALGMQSNGLIFSNTSTYLINHVINFVLDHVYSSTLRDATPEKLRQAILMTDIPALVWAFATTMYPNGYPFRQPCVAGPDKCTHVSDVIINMGKLMWTDATCITSKMRAHMADRKALWNEEELRNYREEVARNQPKSELIKESVTVTYRVPTISEYVTSGFRWVAELNELVEKAFDAQTLEENRNEYISQQANLAIMRQYSHWVDKLVLAEMGVVADRESIEQSVSLLSTDDEIASKFIEGVTNFIENASFSVIAVPRTKCPVCGTPTTEEYKRHPHLNPIDPVRVFFTLLTQRISLARGQE